MLRQANILTCGIGLPIAPVEGDVNGLRIGTPEIVRWGMTPDDMPGWPDSSPARSRMIAHHDRSPRMSQLFDGASRRCTSSVERPRSICARPHSVRDRDLCTIV